MGTNVGGTSYGAYASHCPECKKSFEVCEHIHAVDVAWSADSTRLDKILQHPYRIQKYEELGEGGVKTMRYRTIKSREDIDDG